MSVHDADYRAIKELLGIPADEPIFIIRGQDRFALPTLSRYKNFKQGLEVRPTEESEKWIAHMNEIIETFDKFQTENPGVVKVPD